MNALRLAELHVYPLKSARGLSPARAPLSTRGLAHDRRFMLADGARFLTQREHPRLALIEIAVEGERVIARAPGHEAFAWPLHPAGGEPRRVRVFDDECDARSLGPEAARWFSSVLGAPCELVHFPDESARQVDRTYAPEGTQVAFADGFPLLLVSRASVEELARRVGAPIEMARFRPNLVVEGCAPFEEDSWARFTIGGLAFEAVKPCARCTIPNVDPQTGEPGLEPLRTLATFRRDGAKVLFGQNVLGPTSGELAVGDRVEVVTWRNR